MICGIVNPYRNAGSSGPVSFYSDLVRFWDVDQGFSLTSGEVNSWTDRVASAQMLPVNGSAKPDFSSTAINGHPGVKCLNANEALYSDFTFTDSTSTMAIVASFSSLSTAWGRIMSLANSAGGGDGGATTVSLLRSSSTSSVAVYASAAPPSTVAIGYDTPKAFLIDYNATTLTLYVNNVSSSTLSVGTTLNINRIGIFREIAASGNEDAKGAAGDIMIVNRQLTSTERAELQTYWAAKFGL